MPIADYGNDEHDQHDQQKAGSFRGIDGVAMALVTSIFLALRENHGCIVTLFIQIQPIFGLSPETLQRKAEMHGS
jgi:hypothetical protein